MKKRQILRSLRRSLLSYQKTLAAIIALSLSSAHAATFTVTNLNDSGPGSLRQAILDANNALGADTIIFQGSALVGVLRTVGGLLITDTLTILGPNGDGADLTIEGDNIHRIFRIDYGKTANLYFLHLQSGGIENSGTLLLDRSSILSSNFGNNGNGGAIYNDSYGILTINHGYFQRNSTAGSGGAIYNYGALTINNSTLHINSAGSAGGGIGIGGGTVTVNNSTISSNTASEGGGIDNARNNAPFATLTLTNSIVYNNTALIDGGGINNRSSASVTIRNSTISGNVARNGYGGGIFANGTANLVNITVTANSAPAPTTGRGGGIYIPTGLLHIGNSLVAGNNAINGKEVYNGSGTFASQGNNLFGENAVSGLVNASPVLSDIILASSIDTAIAPLADNGGPTLTHLPVAGSPAIDAGNNALIPAGIVTDQRGLARISRVQVDIGAVELSPYNPAHSDFNGNGTEDLAGLTSSGQIFYSTDLTSWRNMPGILAQLRTGDLNSDGKADLAGLTGNGQVFYSTDLATWHNIPGILAQLRLGDLNGDGKADLAGLTSDGRVFYSINLATWYNIPGILNRLVVADLNDDGLADLAGLTATGQVFYSTDLATWHNIPGILNQLITGDLNGDGKADLIGLTTAGQIFYSTDLATWRNIPGILNQLVSGHLDSDSKADLIGLTATGQIFYSTDLSTWTNSRGSLAQIRAGDYDGNGAADLAGLATTGQIFYNTITPYWSWRNIPGTLSSLAEH